MGFVNLHNHTDRGSYDAILSHKAFIERIGALGQGYVVQTDHGTLNSMTSLAKKAQKAGLKYIPGCEFYLTYEDPYNGVDSFGARYYHVLVIAKTNEGLKNIQRLLALSWDKSRYYYKNRISFADLVAHREGLIVTSGCLAGVLPKSIVAESYCVDPAAPSFRGLHGEGCQCRTSHRVQTWRSVPRNSWSPDIAKAWATDYLLGNCDDDVPPTPEELSQWKAKFDGRDMAQKMRSRKPEVVLERFLTYFGEDFYLELQDCGAPEQTVVNKALIELGQRKGIPLIVTSDAHYATPEDRLTRQMLMMIRLRQVETLKEEVTDDSGDFLEGAITHLKSEEELRAVRQRLPGGGKGGSESGAEATEEFVTFPDEAFASTVELAKKVTTTIDLTRRWFPVPPLASLGLRPLSEGDKGVEAGMDLPALYRARIRALAVEGLRKRIEVGLSRGTLKESDIPRYEAQLDEELEVIDSLGFTTYFLVLCLIMEKARERGVFFGAGRGSAAGSLVCWALRVTDVDPLRYKLYFTRFLNRFRVSLPDVDVDLPSEERSEVFRIIKEEFGEENVAQVITFLELKPRSLAKDLGRILGLGPLGEEIASFIPPGIQGKQPTVEEVLDTVPELSQARYGPIVSKMRAVESLTRAHGKHPAGLVITPVPVSEIAPYKVIDDEELGRTKILQIAGDELEDAGLVKFDFLGLRNLSIMRECMKAITEKEGRPFTLDDIPDEDPAVYARIQTLSDMGGLFQLENSPKVQELLLQCRPDSLEVIAAVLALWRPGPLAAGMHTMYAQRRMEGWKPDPDNVLDVLLEDTMGCIIYQEQLMSLSKDLAGFTEVEADEVRRAVGKKKPEDIAKWKGKFFEGCEKAGRVSGNTARDIWKSFEGAGAYAFNRSHSVAYAKLTYQCAWVITYYPAIFFASLLRVSAGKKEKLLPGIHTSRSHGLEILPPSLAHLEIDSVAVGEGAVRLGLRGCKHIAGSSEELEPLKKMAPSDLLSIPKVLAAINRSKFNVAAATSLAYAGLFDDHRKVVGLTRSGLVLWIRDLYEWFKKGKEKASALLRWEERFKERADAEARKARGEWAKGERLPALLKRPECPPMPDPLSYVHVEADPLYEAFMEFDILGTSISRGLRAITKLSPYVRNIASVMREVESKAEVASKPRKVKVPAVLAGFVSSFVEKRTNEKKLRCDFVLEDDTGALRLSVSTKVYEECAETFRGKLKHGTYAVVSITASPNDTESGVLARVSCLRVYDLTDPDVRSALTRAEAYENHDVKTLVEPSEFLTVGPSKHYRLRNTTFTPEP